MMILRLRPFPASTALLAVAALLATACSKREPAGASAEQEPAVSSTQDKQGGADASKSEPAFPVGVEAKVARTPTTARPDRILAEETLPRAGDNATAKAVATPDSKPAEPHTTPTVGDDEPTADASRQFFTHYGVNPTIDARENPLSTFGIDVDTAAYVMARSHLDGGRLPPADAIRVEEVVNYFDYHYAPPVEGDFSMHAEVVPSPHRQGYHVLHLGLKGREIAAADRPAANLVFVIDVSGSMGTQGRLTLVKQSLQLLVDQLRARDRVGIVAYGSGAKEILAPTSGSERDTILAAIDKLRTEGSTNVEAGLKMGYALAERQAMGAGINRVVLCSDGVANTGSTTAQAILDRVAEHAGRGITITTIGVGMGDYNDTLMEQLADKGNGNYAYVDDRAEARRVFVDHLTGTLAVIAKDVKLQLEFDPGAVERYRLLGYENRGLTASEFDDDRKDAGELGAGHTVTALYEIKLRPGEHQQLGTLRVRYKTPRATASSKLERKLPFELVRASWEQAAAPTRLSVVAAAYAEKLRGSYWVRNLAWSEVQRMYDQIDAELRGQAEVRELGRLIDRAAELDQRSDRFESDMPLAKMDFDRVPVLR